ncbi:MAG TPA: MFS transporter [Firmicutes bacterium]|nr:MFS transporter [Bacillota bacterium]
MKNKENRRISPAMVFILLFGVVSLLSDMTHEGAASIQGSYLSLIGASATTIGFISGLGELLGYSLRYVFGKIADRTKKYWALTIAGYLIDTLVVPLMAFVGPHGWIWACVLLSIQRVGKAIKKPSKDTILSFAATQEKVGKSFGIQEMLDQIGAFLGPLFLYVIMLFKVDSDTYRTYAFCFLLLLIPALATIFMLLFTKHKFPNPENFEPQPKKREKFKMRASFVLYIAGISLFALGFLDYSLIGMHITKVFVDAGSKIITSQTLPLIYSGAMIIDAISALIFGRLYDRFGVLSLIIATALSSIFSLFIFNFASVPMLLIGVALWGIGMGAQESIMKAVVTTMVPKDSRATGYGIFECSFGLFGFLGSWLMGAIYDTSIIALIVVSIAAQALSIPCYLISYARKKKESDNSQVLI